MHTGVADVALQFLRIFQRVAQDGVRTVGRLLQLGHDLNGRLERVYAVGNQLSQPIRLPEWQLLHTRHVLNGQFGSHRAIGDDVGHVILPVFLRHPFEHLATTVVVEVDVDIRHRDTVRVEETLEQQVVLDRVDVRNAEAIGHDRSCGRSTPGPYRYTHLTRRCDEVLHDEEVTREAHLLDRVQLEVDAVARLVRDHTIVTVQLPGALEGEMAQIVGFKLDADHLLVASQTQVIVRHDAPLGVRIVELLHEVFGGVFSPIRLLRSERRIDLEEGHQRGRVDGVHLHLVSDLYGVAQRLGHIGEDGVHLGRRLDPLLFGVSHTVWVVDLLARAEADQSLVRIGVVLVHEMRVVRSDQFHAVLSRKLHQHPVHLHLLRIRRRVRIRRMRLVALQLEVEIFAEESLEPQQRLLGLVLLTGHDQLRDLTPEASRGDDQPLVIAFQKLLIDPRIAIKALRPSQRNELDEVLVAREILSQDQEMPAAQVVLFLLLEPTVARAVALAADDRLEETLATGADLLREFAYALRLLLRRMLLIAERTQLLLAVLDGGGVLTILLLDLVVKLLDAKHVSMIGQGDGRHAVALRLIDQRIDRRLAIEQRVLRMNV